MFQTLISTLRAEVSGAAAKNCVADIARFHRIQASPGFRAAAHYVADALRGFGLEARVISYPADGETIFWSMRTFMEWDCKEAALWLLDKDGKVEQKLADYREEKVSVIQRSAPVDGEFEVVVLDTGEEASDYEGVDVKGRLVLTRGRIDRITEMAVRQRGAAGVLFDGMMTAAPVRERIDLPDARQYTSFWFRGGEILSVFWFVLTPRQGDALRERCKRAAAEGKPPVRVRARVDSSLYAGQMEVVEAFLPGETDQEVLLVAHLCHPQPSANDNASGAGALLEAARTLAKCIQDGKLARPKRGIRCLWVPEMSGTYAYLASHEQDIPRMVAGLNLDMVGEDQEKCGSSLLLELPPASMSSFATALAQSIRDAVLGGGKTHGGQGNFPLVRWADSPFSGGSDHYILSDPSVGVPTPMIIQWPDKFYHTSHDTLDKVSPEMLGIVVLLTTSYAYSIANAGKREAEWLAHEMTARFKREVMQRTQSALAASLDSKQEAPSEATLKREIRFLLGRLGEALATLRRLADVDAGPFQAESAAFAESEVKRAASFLGKRDLKPSAPPSGEWETKAASIVPSRRYRGPLSVSDLVVKTEDRETLHRFVKESPEVLYVQADLAMYWVDGERTLSDIAHLVQMETGKRSTEALVKYFEFLARIGGIELRSSAQK